MATSETKIKRKHPLAKCEECPLASQPCAPTVKPPQAKIAIVSRSPGFYEAQNGKPFSGPSGKILDHLFNIYGVKRNEVIQTNVVLCTTEVPSPAAIAACRDRLHNDIKDCETVIAAGSEAAYEIAGETSIAVGRGFVHKSSGGQRVVVTNNPAVLLREPAAYPEIVRDFKLALDPIEEPELPQVRYTDNVDQGKLWIAAILGSIKKGSILSSDIETRRGSDGNYTELVCAGFATSRKRAVVFGEQCCNDEDFVRHYLRRLWEIEDCLYLWHNGKYDVKVLRKRYGINARVDHDTMLLSASLDERPGDPSSGAGGHALEWLLKDELGWPRYEPSSVWQFKKTGIVQDAHELYTYNGMDCAGSLALFEVLKQKAIEDGTYEKPYLMLRIPASEVIARMELEGMLYDDVAAADMLEDQVWPTLDALQEDMQQISGIATLNPNSPLQLVKLLYDQWGLRHELKRPAIEKWGKKSVDQWVRKEVIEGRFRCTGCTEERMAIFMQKLQKFKKLDKQRGTYLEGLINKRAPNGRIYYEFNINGTESGRLSGKNPNMQNITRPEEGLPDIRKLFLADPGCMMIEADYNQAELRTIAYLSQDDALMNIYLDAKRSLHKEVAKEFYGENYTPTQYVYAKNINFGIVYEQSAFSFAQMYGMSQKEAQRFIDWWWDRFPGVRTWSDRIQNEAIGSGVVQSPFGHKRRFPLIVNEDHARKEAVNFLPQNIAANLTLYALIEFGRKVDWKIAQPRITVHDAIMVNCKTEHVEEVSALLLEVMHAAPKEALGWDFPFTAEIGYGPTWGDCK